MYRCYGRAWSTFLSVLAVSCLQSLIFRHNTFKSWMSDYAGHCFIIGLSRFLHHLVDYFTANIPSVGWNYLAVFTV